jgi:hypothetical protein
MSMASKDHRRSQSFPGEDASHTHETKRTNTYIRKKPKDEKRYTNIRSAVFLGNESSREEEREVPKSHMVNSPRKDGWKGQDIINRD